MSVLLFRSIANIYICFLIRLILNRVSKHLVAILIFMFGILIQAQSTKVSGVILDENSFPISDVLVSEKNTNHSTYSDMEGNFELKVNAGTITILYQFDDYVGEKNINILQGESKELELIIQSNQIQLDDTVIVGKSVIDKIEETGYNVVAISAKPFYNSTTSMSQVIQQAPGVRIEEVGGVGSRTNVSINGLSGRHIRFFIDGMPMDAMSSSFQMNNLPVNLAERIEVYKGVVPIKFGSDALGGAVNIVTTKNAGKFLDASYSYGSFNTNHTYINAGFTSKSGFTAQINAFQNYSDNNYFVDVKIKDFETNLLSQDTRRVRRFHDEYHNETVIAKVGLVHKSFADQLLFGFTFANEYDEIQHPAYLNLAFGEKYQTSNTIMPSILYSKKDLFLNNLDFSFAANYNLGSGNNYDLSNKEYNWLGESVPSNSPGEIQYSDFEYKDNNGTINANLDFEINPNHRLTVNNVYSFFARDGDEKTTEDDLINEKPRINNRNILGAGINSDFGRNFSTSVFGKMYSYFASAYLNLSQQNGIENFQMVDNSGNLWGYGATATYFLQQNLQLKSNFELTRRLPVSAELFGEVFGFYLANFNLKPEKSFNYNFGAIYSLPINENHIISADVNLFHRRTSDMIRLNVNYSQGKGSYINEDLVKTTGVDAEFRYSYKDRFALTASVSYFNPLLYKDHANSSLNGSKLPNQSTFFGNVNANYFLKDVWLKTSRLSFSYNMRFSEEFLYDYDVYQAANRAVIPQQWKHDFSSTYSWQNGKYNFSFDVKNIFDAKLFDNYSLQKPGRSFAVKFRYYFQKY